MTSRWRANASRTLLAQQADIEVVGECPDGPQAVAAIERLAPQLVFLDVQMPGRMASV